jgi:hypothetical protein
LIKNIQFKKKIKIKKDNYKNLKKNNFFKKIEVKAVGWGGGGIPGIGPTCLPLF